MSQQSASCLSSPSTGSGNVDKVYLWDRDLSFSIQFIMTYTCIVMIMTKQWPSMNLRWGSAYIGTKTKRRLQRACSFSCLLQQLLAFFYKLRSWYLWRLFLKCWWWFTLTAGGAGGHGVNVVDVVSYSCACWWSFPEARPGWWWWPVE